MNPQDIGFKEDNKIVQQALEQIAKVASNPEQKSEVVAKLKDDFANAKDNETAFVIEYASSVIAAYPDTAALANAIERGSRDALQEYISKATLPEEYNSGDLGSAVHASIDLAKEKHKQSE